MRYPALALAALLLVLPGTGAAQVLQADNADLARLLDEGVPVVDIRTAAEWRDTGVLANSHLMTFFDEQGRYDVNAWLTRFAAIVKPDQRVAIICLSGSRSMVLSHFLHTRAGYSQVINVTRGIDRWIRDGHPTAAYP